MEARPPERLVCVDVPTPAKSLWSRTSAFSGAAAGDPVGEGARRERPAERLGPDPLREVGVELAGLEEEPGSETAHVAVGDVRVVV